MCLCLRFGILDFYSTNTSSHSAASKRPSRGALSQGRIGALPKLAEEVVHGCVAAASGVPVPVARIVVDELLQLLRGASSSGASLTASSPMLSE